MNKYLVVHSHAHGISTYLVEWHSLPTEKQVIRCLDISYEPSRSENLEIVEVPNNEPVKLDWQDSDAEDFDEFADEEDE